MCDTEETSTGGCIGRIIGLVLVLWVADTLYRAGQDSIWKKAVEAGVAVEIADDKYEFKHDVE